MVQTPVILTRLQTGNEGTFGRISVDGVSYYSGELPDRDNAPNVSCIPKGSYPCIWTYSEKLKRKAYLVQNVKGRAGIRIHSANFMGDDSKGFKRQLNGCIALGEKIGQIDGQRALLLSKPAVRKFEDLMQGQPFILEIR